MSGRVLVGDPSFDLADVRARLDGTGLAVEAAGRPWRGEDVVALLVGPDYPVDADDFARLPSLRIVASCSVGYDHVDVAAAAARGVWVTNVPDYCVEEMADTSLALVLALLRGVVVLDRSVLAGAWDHRAAGPLPRLAGTRLAVVGFGRIGRALAARALALGMEVWASDPLVPAEVVRGAGARPASLDEALAACRAVSLHLPLTPESEGLIGAAELARLPEGAVLVNTARARLVDLDALLAALESGRLAGAALDVLPVEPPDPEAPAPSAPNLIVLPHAAWYSPEAEEAVYRRPVEAVRAALAGAVPDGVAPGTGP